MRILIGLMALILAGCTQPPATDVPVAIYRDTAAQIASQTNVTADRMAGDWIMRQAYAPSGRVGRKVAIAALTDDLLQISFSQLVCLHGECIPHSDTPVTLVPTGPGRWAPVDPPVDWSDGELWVMWMDFDSRTAAIGTPSGEFGWIIDRNLTGGGDRITAARDIMDWFGYDLTQLQKLELIR